MNNISNKVKGTANVLCSWKYSMTQLWSVTCIWDHTVLRCYLPPESRHKWTHPALTPAMQAGTQFTYPGGMEGWVDLVDLIAPQPGVEPATFQSRVRRRTTAPPRQQWPPAQSKTLPVIMWCCVLVGKDGEEDRLETQAVRCMNRERLAANSSGSSDQTETETETDQSHRHSLPVPAVQNPALVTAVRSHSPSSLEPLCNLWLFTSR